MNLSLRNLVHWQPLTNPEPGYTVVIGCMNNMAEIALANVEFISRMHLPNLRELLLVFDVQPQNFDHAETFLPYLDRLPIRLIHYNPFQEFWGKLFSWGWVYSWISWTQAIAEAKTQSVLLHDLDAIPINPHLFEEQYAKFQENQTCFQGVFAYADCNHIIKEDGFVRTFEMFLDAQQLRSQFRPFDAFTKVGMIGDRLVVFDTFLHLQNITKPCCLEPIQPEELVHPSQLISQYTHWLCKRPIQGEYGGQCNLPLLPIYFYLGGNPEPLTEILNHLEQHQHLSPQNSSWWRVPFNGTPMDFSGIPSQHWQWLAQQTELLVKSYQDEVDDRVDRYLAFMHQA